MFDSLRVARQVNQTLFCWQWWTLLSVATRVCFAGQVVVYVSRGLKNHAHVWCNADLLRFLKPAKTIVLLHAEFEHWFVFTWFRVIKHALRILWLPKCWFACLALYRVKGWLIEMGVILITCPCWRDVVVSNFGNRLRNKYLFLAAKANLSAFCSPSFMWKPLYAQGNFDRVPMVIGPTLVVCWG